MTPPSVILPAPVIVKVRPVALFERLTIPNVVVPVLLTVSVRLPPEFVNVPLNVRSLLPPMVPSFMAIIVLFEIERLPPLAAIAPPDKVRLPLPKALLFPIFNVPPKTVVPPL